MTTLHNLNARPDVWAADNATLTVCMRITAEAQTDVPCRVLNLLAMQYLMADNVEMAVAADRLNIELHVPGITWHRAEVIAQRMRGLIAVAQVELEAWEVQRQTA